MLLDMLQQLDDIALMSRYRDDGDVIAFEELYGRHKGPIYRYLLRQCGNREVAEDLFQEVWTRIIKARESYRAIAQFNTYLYRVAHNCVIDNARKRKVRPGDQNWDSIDDHPPVATGKTPEEESALEEIAAQLRVALDSLSDEQREAFLLHQESGLTLEQIGRVVGVGRETIKSRLRYAVMHLRRRLTAESA